MSTLPSWALDNARRAQGYTANASDGAAPATRMTPEQQRDAERVVQLRAIEGKLARAWNGARKTCIEKQGKLQEKLCKYLTGTRKLTCVPLLDAIEDDDGAHVYTYVRYMTTKTYLTVRNETVEASIDGAWSKDAFSVAHGALVAQRTRDLAKAEEASKKARSALVRKTGSEAKRRAEEQKLPGKATKELVAKAKEAVQQEIDAGPEDEAVVEARRALEQATDAPLLADVIEGAVDASMRGLTVKDVQRLCLHASREAKMDPETAPVTKTMQAAAEQLAQVMRSIRELEFAETDAALARTVGEMEKLFPASVGDGVGGGGDDDDDDEMTVSERYNRLAAVIAAEIGDRMAALQSFMEQGATAGAADGEVEDAQPEYFDTTADRPYTDDADDDSSAAAGAPTRFRIDMKQKVTQRAKAFKASTVRPLVRAAVRAEAQAKRYDDASVDEILSPDHPLKRKIYDELILAMSEAKAKDTVMTKGVSLVKAVTMKRNYTQMQSADDDGDGDGDGDDD
jgi:hypothetical protein